MKFRFQVGKSGWVVNQSTASLIRRLSTLVDDHGDNEKDNEYKRNDNSNLCSDAEAM